jgi:hypothetical protein
VAGRAIVLALGKVEDKREGSDIEVMLSALIMVAAGIIAKDAPLTTRREVRLRTEEFGKMLREMALADRAAGDADEAMFIDILGGVALIPPEPRTAN